ncbi:arylsulfatase [Muricauda sp. ANG21]|uniref:arylsulfatase n=1 Tax=Allomuricauda sp. ANG21 TaxID=3042468 RepID=UPI003454A1CB
MIVVDDLGYGDLGCYGQRKIKTPNIDAFAANGIKFTDFYAGSPVCAPSRSVLMTGKHTGHTTVRGNFGRDDNPGSDSEEKRIPLRDNDTTVAEVLKGQGYSTAITGKWGLGEPNTSGLPNNQGFDEWFGYLNQKRAHSHFPDYIWKNGKKYRIKMNAKGGKRVYSHSLFTNFAIDFIERKANKEKPFFLYVPYLLPHKEYEIPEINKFYKNMPWSPDEKVYASMVSLIDKDFGRIWETVQNAGIEKNTLIIFTSDNGAAKRWDGTFDSSGGLRGKKRDVYEGGIRVPLIISMPGTVQMGKTNNSISYFGDLLPTLQEFGGSVPQNRTLDGVSLHGVLLQNSMLDGNRVLYWEFHEEGGKQAVRQGKWKAVRLDIDKRGLHSNLELYDLDKDMKEEKNLSQFFPDTVEYFREIMEREHVVSNNFPFDFEGDK